MSDIVERLKKENTHNGVFRAPQIQIEAANEIERLRKYEVIVKYITSTYLETNYDNTPSPKNN